VESVEVVRAYGGLLNLVLSRGRLLLKLQSAVAGLRKAAGEHAQVPVSLEKACLDLKDDVEELDHQIKVRRSVLAVQRRRSGPSASSDARAMLCCC
jgi:hypothetical protein